MMMRNRRPTSVTIPAPVVSTEEITGEFALKQASQPAAPVSRRIKFCGNGDRNVTIPMPFNW